MKAQLLCMLVTVYMIQHTVTLAAYSIHTVKSAAANFTLYAKFYTWRVRPSCRKNKKKQSQKYYDYTKS